MLVRLAKLSDSQAITDIYNQGIEDRSSTFETQPRTVEDMQPKVADMSRYPVLVVELDGRSHDDRFEYDDVRQSRIESRGFRVLRIANDDVLDDIESVVVAILSAVSASRLEL